MDKKKLRAKLEGILLKKQETSLKNKTLKQLVQEFNAVRKKERGVKVEEKLDTLETLISKKVREALKTAMAKKTKVVKSTKPAKTTKTSKLTKKKEAFGSEFGKKFKDPASEEAPVDDEFEADDDMDFGDDSEIEGDNPEDEGMGDEDIEGMGDEDIEGMGDEDENFDLEGDEDLDIGDEDDEDLDFDLGEEGEEHEAEESDEFEAGEQEEGDFDDEGEEGMEDESSELDSEIDDENKAPVPEMTEAQKKKVRMDRMKAKALTFAKKKVKETDNGADAFDPSEGVEATMAGTDDLIDAIPDIQATGLGTDNKTPPGDELGTNDESTDPNIPMDKTDAKPWNTGDAPDAKKGMNQEKQKWATTTRKVEKLNYRALMRGDYFSEKK